MPLISSIYDAYAIQPDVQIGQNVGIYITNGYEYHTINYIEGIPAGPASTIDMVAQLGLTAIAANATLQKSVVPMLQMYYNELIKVRFMPIDNVECRIWELSGQAKNMARNLQSRTDRNSQWYDKYMSMVTFWVLGFNYDMNLEVLNPLGYAQPTARVKFWGWRYLLNPAMDLLKLSQKYMEARPTLKGVSAEHVAEALRGGDPDWVKNVLGPVTFIPAQGKQS